MTLLQVINTIQKISSVQPNIHSFVGEFLALNDVTAKYSAIILQQRTHRRNNDFMTYSFYLGYADRLNEDKSNEVEVQSTAIQVIDDIVYKLENLNFDCTVGVYNTFTQRFLAEAAGGYVELDIVVPMGECEDDFAEEKLDTTITANGEYNFIPKGLGFQSVHLNVDVAHLQDKSLDITKNGNYKVQYDKGYSGLGKVDVNVNIDTDEYYEKGKEDGIVEGQELQKSKLTDINIIENNTTYTNEDGYRTVTVNIDTKGIYNQGVEDGTSIGIQQQKDKLTDISITENGTYEKEDGYKSVVVNVPTVNNQEKSITITENGQTDITPDTNYTGLSKVGVNVNIDTQSYYDNGYSQGKIDGKTEGISEQKAKLTDIEIVENGVYERTDGYKKVEVNVPSPVIDLRETEITPETTEQIITPDGFNGYNRITVKGVDSSIDSDIKPENIKSGVNILGVEGNLEGVNNQEKSITITENGQTDITPDTNYTGLSKVGVNVNIDTQSYYDNGYSQGKIDGKTEGISEQKAKLTDISITENGTYEKEDGYKSVVVNVPSDKKPETELTKTLTANDTYTYTPDEGTVYNKVIITTDIHPTERLERTYVENGQYLINGEYKDGVINVNVPVPEINNQEKSITINSNGTSSVVPDAGYTGISKVDITVDVPTSGGDGFDLTLLGYTAQENTSINTNIQDSIAHSQSLLENYTDGTIYADDRNMMFAPLFPCGNRKNFYNFFYMCSSLISIPTLNTSNGTNFNGMFYGCDSLTSIPALNTSNGTNFNGMFYGCDSLTSVPSLDTSKGTNFISMFFGCNSLTSVPSLDTSKGTNFNGMFSYCRSLTSVPSLDTSKGTNFNSMFYDCRSLTSVPTLNTSNGTDFNGMFYSSTNLETISLINISNTDNKKNLSQMFSSCSKLKNITFEGSINADISFYYTKILTYDSIKSILTACSKTTNTNAKTIEFNQSITDQNNELTNLVASCTSKGWTVSGLTITTA